MIRIELVEDVLGKVKRGSLILETSDEVRNWH
jgi:hypothetical protein